LSLLLLLLVRVLLQIEDCEAEGVLEPGTAPEVSTYLIISAAQVRQPGNKAGRSSSSRWFYYHIHIS
jgi:hypothetical protein